MTPVGANGPWWRDEEKTAAMDLSDEQIEAIRSLMIEGRKLVAQQRQRERTTNMSFIRALNQDPYDPELVDRLQREFIENQVATHERRLSNVRKLRDILTYDQWITLREIAPQALQIGRFRPAFGKRLSVTNEDPNADVTEEETSAP